MRPLYFAYGSNMDVTQMIERCPSAKYRCTAVALGYRLGFTRFSQGRQCGVADIVADQGAEVWGAVFDMAPEDLSNLDRKEGVFLKPRAYRRVPITVRRALDDEPISAFTYEVVTKAAQEIRPNAAYMKQIIDGAVLWGLPQQYIDKLKKIDVRTWR